MGASVSGLATTAVKGTRIGAVERIELGTLGARGNRKFCVIDARGRTVNAKVIAGIQTVVSSHDLESGELTLTFGDGVSAHGVVKHGETVAMRFFSASCDGQLIIGPWSDALSQFFGQPLRLVEPEIGVDRGPQGSVSLISRASVQHLAEVAGEESLDVRRFRMLIEIDGVAPYEEDSWVGRTVRIGPARVAMNGNVGRCLITSRDPESGEVNLPTLKLLASYRREMPSSTEPLPFGIYGEVIEPGAVGLGDPVAVEG